VYLADELANIAPVELEAVLFEASLGAVYA
jgi:hypothetical protein